VVHDGRLNMRKLLCLLLFCSITSGAFAQGGKATRILVGFPPGQPTDLIARLIAERLGPALGETVIVENRPGQGASVVLAQLAKLHPDGTSMVLAPLASMVANPHLYKSVGYDPLKDFEHVALVADLPFLLVATRSSPIRTLPELIAYAKKNPGQLTHPSSGNGTLSHVGMEDLKRRAGISMLHVPYQGSPRAIADLVSGVTQVALDTVTATRPFIESGALRLLASAYGTRLPDFTDTPTIAEQGFPGFNLSAWLGVVVPARTPKARVERLSVELLKIIQMPDMIQSYAALGVLPRVMGANDFRGFVQAEFVRWAAIVKASGAKAN
jgi:tripartite-type tricarboxylate transporter receptor subunit TctC